MRVVVGGGVAGLSAVTEGGELFGQGADLSHRSLASLDRRLAAWLTGEPLGDDAGPRTGASYGAGLDFDLLARSGPPHCAQRIPACVSLPQRRWRRRTGGPLLARSPAISPRGHRQQHVDELASLLGEEVVVAERLLGAGQQRIRGPRAA